MEEVEDRDRDRDRRSLLHQLLFIISMFFICYVTLSYNFYGDGNQEMATKYSLIVKPSLASKKNVRFKMACGDISSVEESMLFPSDENKFVVSSHGDCGGLANQMYRFASLYGIGKKCDRRPALFWKHFNFCEMDKSGKNEAGQTAETFPIYWRNLAKVHEEDVQKDMASFPNFDSHGYDDPENFNFSSLPQKHLVLGNPTGNYFQNYRYFHEYRKDIRKIFKFPLELCEKVENYANSLFGSVKREHKFCVHTRRGDMLQFGFGSKREFAEKAINFVGNQLKELHRRRISVVLLGEDKQFLQSLQFNEKLFSNIYQPKAMSRGEDMALVALKCDSLLITLSASSYAWWIGYLMPDHSRVYFNANFKNKDGNQWTNRKNFLPEWTPLNISEDGDILISR